MQKSRLWQFATLLVLLSMIVTPFAGASAAQQSRATVPQQSNRPALLPSNLTVATVTPVTSPPLSALPPLAVEGKDIEAFKQRAQQRLGLPKTQGGDGAFDASIIQDQPGTISMPSPSANFDGVNNINGVLPPDTEGDIGYDPNTGKKYYIQWVNLSFQIWDVTNPAAPVSVYGPAAGNTLFSALGNNSDCASHNDGDPIVLFDHLANRWLLSQFAVNPPDGPYYQCIAISASSDPLGAWYLYDFQTSATKMNDYPKFGVWPDGYYLSVNQFDSSGWAGAGVAAFQRTAMLAGAPAQMQYFDVGAVTLNYGGMLPSDLDGPPPAAGTPNYFMEWDDSTWLGDPQDTLRIWEFHVDWSNPANTTFGTNANHDPNLMISTANVDPDMCSFNRNCIPQPGTTSKLDAISDRLMYRLQYRNFGTYATLVTNHTVDVGSDHAGIHWFELRDTGSGFAIYQEGVYAPDSDHRWMGSIAMDNSGDIALGYSVSSTSTYPSVRYAGRLSSDPLNSLPQAEATLIAGGGSQTHTASRWGDYSMMGLDPTDGCTFWYTQEYYATTSSAGWKTRIGSFQFPSCTSAPTGTLAGTVTDSASNPISGAQIAISGGYFAYTNASGQYSIALPPGSYDVTASKYGYNPVTVTGVSVTASTTTTQDFVLPSSTTYTISGTVTDSATGWPLYAQISISGYPGSPIFTDPSTGVYSVNLVAGSYTFTVTSLIPGYDPQVQPVNVTASATQNFALSAAASCTAPGYGSAAIFSEGFEGTFPPSGWNLYETGGDPSPLWQQGTSGTSGSHGEPHSGTYYAWHNDDYAAVTNIVSWLVTPQLSIPAGGASFTFWQRGYWGDYYTYHGVWLTTGSTPDPTISTYIELWNGNTETSWSQQVIDLSAYAGQNVYLAFRYEGDFSDEWYIDDVELAEPCSPIAGYGLVIGAVYDASSSAPISNAIVKDASNNPATWFDTSADPATPPKMYVIAEPAGSVSLTASAYKYTSNTQTPSVVANSTVAQNFFLGSGQLSIVPSTLTFTVTAGNSASQSLTLSNTGTSAADFRIFRVPGTWSGYTPTGPFAPNTRHVGPKRLNDLNASAVYTPSIPTGIPPLAAGDVSASWATGLAYPWGIGFNLDANDLWLGNIAAGGGDDLDYRFLTDGTNTGDTIDTAPWVGAFAADMTYNPFTKTLWQVNVGGDNCIYELDPALKISTGNKICPAFGTSERGLAFDPVTNTYYAGSWNDAILNRFAPDGTLLSSVNVNLDISGLAFNPSTGHLFVLSNTDSTNPGTTGSYDITVLDVNNSYAVVGGFNIMNGSTPVFGNTFGQAGLEIDCNGDLWIVNQSDKKVYKAASGETGVCNWQSTWLTVSPDNGTVAVSGNQSLTATADATALAAGTYQAYLRVTSNTPYPDLIVPVTLTVVSPDTTPPTVISIVRQSPTNQVVTSGDTVTFRVTFSEDVTSVDTGDFSLTLLSVPGSNASISSINQVSASIYDVTVDVTGIRNTKNMRDGAIRLDIPNTATIQDLAGNALSGLPYTDGEIYSIVEQQTFDDVVANSHPFWTWIERLFYMGITGGCDSNNFCPTASTSRAQMAVFLLRGEHGYTYTPPPVGDSTGFNDVAVTDPFAAWIKQLAAEGITGGCGGGNYCPNDPVTRGEMAVFLLRAEHGGSYTPPAVGDSTGFNDVPVTDPFAAWIKQLAAEGITGGCGNGNYCPTDPVTRGQMAVFLIRTFNLP